MPLADPARLAIPRYPIRAVARRVGIAEITLRAWERRYGAVTPARSARGQRLYTAADIERIALLHALSRAGAAISSLAELPTATLRAMAPDVAAQVAQVADETGEAARASQPAPTPAHDFTLCTRAVAALDFDRLQRVLMRLVLELGTLAFLDEIATPLCAWIGEEWSHGRLSEVQESTASTVIRQVFAFLLETLRRERRQRHVVLATLAGERHEFGAMMAGIVAAFDGWSYHYLGVDLPASTVGATAKRLDATLLAVSVVAPRNVARHARELVELRRAVGRRIPIVVGGAAAPLLHGAVDDVRGVRIDSLVAWREHLVRRASARSRARA